MICQGLTREQSNALYLEVLESRDTEALRRLCREDLFFLLTVACKRKDIDKDWLYERIREVELNPNDHLDLWAREHYKSTIITFGKTIQNILNNQNITIGIFSHTRPIAKDFLKQIKRELETNSFLQNLFPEILYTEPQKEAVKWSEDSGLIVKRTSNPKDATLEAWGLVDGQPTGKHFDLLIYDDVVTMDSVSTPEQIAKTTRAIEMSYNLGARGGHRRAIGTRYHVNDTYKVLMDRGTFRPRIHTATKDGTADGEPVLMSKEQLAEKRRDMGPYTFGTQMLQDPVSDKAMGFKKEWLKYVETKLVWEPFNRYIIVDPAGSKKKLSGDYTTIAVIGLGPDGNYYRIDGIRDRMNLTERTKKLFEFHRKYKPHGVGYESYGMQADIEHIKYVMEIENYRFNITELGGQMPKADRIRRLIPIYEQGRFYSPKTITFIDYQGKAQNYVEVIENEEYLIYPVVTHDDGMDCVARILDPELGAKFPQEETADLLIIDDGYSGDHSWMR
jgi:phage terminase large subunit-like protein